MSARASGGECLRATRSARAACSTRAVFLRALHGVSRGGQDVSPFSRRCNPKVDTIRSGDARGEQPGHRRKLTGAESQRDHELPPVCGRSWQRAIAAGAITARPSVTWPGEHNRPEAMRRRNPSRSGSAGPADEPRSPRLFPHVYCELDFTNPLELTVATILSAQSTGQARQPTTPALFEKYRTALDYAQADRAGNSRSSSGPPASTGTRPTH